MTKLWGSKSKRVAERLSYDVLDWMMLGVLRGAIEELRRPSVDERLAKIEDAKHNLTEALTAIEDMQADAEERRRTLKMLSDRINRARSDKAGVESELKVLETIAELDPQGVRQALRIPTSGQIWRGHFLSFALGILGSVLASWLWSMFSGGAA